jgi:hypothetical protein
MVGEIHSSLELEAPIFYTFMLYNFTFTVLLEIAWLLSIDFQNTAYLQTEDKLNLVSEGHYLEKKEAQRRI